MRRSGSDSSGPHIELKIQSHPANLAPTRKAIEDFGGQCGFGEEDRGQIGLCVNEALANVIRHAYGGATDRPIVIEARYGHEVLRISIRDWGSGVMPQDCSPEQHDPRVPGGLGLICMRRMMDTVSFSPQPDGMLLEMSRKRRPVAPAASARSDGA